MSDFKDAKVGDRVWSTGNGWGEISAVGLDRWPISVSYPNKSTRYSHGGIKVCESVQTLFWDEVKIVPPPRPKRKVKKVVEGWMYLFKSFSDELVVGGCGVHPTFYPTKESAEAAQKAGGYTGPPVIFIRHEYETEE